MPQWDPSLRAILFDVIGTTMDWVTPVVESLRAAAAPFPELKDRDWTGFAHKWRNEFFSFVKELQSSGKFVSDPYRDVLDVVLAQELGELAGVWDKRARDDLAQSWTKIRGWPDSAPGLELLRRQYIAATISNGSTRSIIDASKASNLSWDMLFNSDLAGAYKPDPRVYLRAIDGLQLQPAECAMAAAHVYDLEAAQKLGMRTIYIVRSTEDIGIDLGKYNFDIVVEEGGLLRMAEALTITGQ